MKNTKPFAIFAILLISLTVLAACQKEPVVQQPGTYNTVTLDFSKDIQTEQFKSQEELLAFIKQNSGASSYYRGGILMGTNAMMEKAVSSDSGSAVAPSAAPDYSQTNVQVAGIDEADIIKTDGNYIYAVSNNVLFIIKAYPGEDAEVVSRIKFNNTPEGVFINGNYIAVFGSQYDIRRYEIMSFSPRSGMSFLNIYDISDKANPELVKDYKFEGYYTNGRMKGDYMYLIITSYPENRAEPMPLAYDGNVKIAMPVDHIYYYTFPYNSPVFVNIHAINLADPSEELNSKAVVVEGSQNLYMSEDNIYLSYTEYVNEYELEQEITMKLLEPRLTTSDKALIEKIKATDDDVLSQYEKQAKIYQVYSELLSSMTNEEQESFYDDVKSELKKKMDEYKYLEFTIINKVHVDQSEIAPVANGKVPGHIINQFAMDEKDGVLRVATTISQTWSRFDSTSTKSTNNVYTLNSDLKTMDELTGLAEGESIYSTRFIEGRLYMVTFRQVDPFFVIDLSDPENIKELGKLKIPGFSRYLHPYDGNTIIGIGQEATEEGRVKGLKISLFDVSDVANPKEIAKYVTEDRYASSTALYEHKAFLFSKEKNLLVIPAYSYDYQDPSEGYNGAMVFDIRKDSITLRGLIDHSDGSQYWQPQVERSLYIGDLLYTKSLSLLRINKLEDLSKVKNIELEYSDPSIPIY